MTLLFGIGTGTNTVLVLALKIVKTWWKIYIRHPYVLTSEALKLLSDSQTALGEYTKSVIVITRV